MLSLQHVNTCYMRERCSDSCSWSCFMCPTADWRSGCWCVPAVRAGCPSYQLCTQLLWTLVQADLKHVQQRGWLFVDAGLEL